MRRSVLSALLAGSLCVGGLSFSAECAFAQSETSLNNCQKTVAKETGKYIRAVADTVGKCLYSASSAVIVAGGDASDAAGKCVASLVKITNTADPAKTLAEKFNAKVGAACDPAINPELAHAESDTYAIGATTLSAANLDTYCSSFGGDGSIGSFNEWRDCLRAAADCQARQAIALQWPRVLEYSGALLAAPEIAGNADALVALTAIDTGIEGPSDDDLPEIACGPDANGVGGLPETGWPGDPGRERTGSFTDNGDGTISDSITGLMWEKLDRNATGDHLHDYFFVYSSWSNAFKKIQVLNGDSTGCISSGLPGACCTGAGTGTCTPFLGHTDWRLPAMIELASLVNYNRYPAAYPEFDTNCNLFCRASGVVNPCSCTISLSTGESETYWTSTSLRRALGDNATWGVNFLTGVIENINTVPELVRAVRGGQ